MKFIKFYIIIVKKQETSSFLFFKLTIIYLLLLFLIRSLDGNYGVFSVESNSQVVCLFAATIIYNIIYCSSVQ